MWKLASGLKKPNKAENQKTLNPYVDTGMENASLKYKGWKCACYFPNNKYTTLLQLNQEATCPKG